MELSLRLAVEERIAAPANLVYALISDLTRMGEWSPENLGSEWVEGEPGAIGARFLGRNRSGEREWEGGGVIIAAVPEREFAWTMGDDPTHPRGTWRYVLDRDGASTHVVESYELGPAPSGFRDSLNGLSEVQVRDRLGAREQQLRDGMQVTLARLKAHAESQSDAGDVTETHRRPTASGSQA